jgi:ubiquinone biosynthesis protein UbiJ
MADVIVFHHAQGLTDGVREFADQLRAAGGRPKHPAVTMQTDVATLRSVAFGREPITAAVRDGRLAVEGDRHLAERFAQMFPVTPR